MLKYLIIGLIGLTTTACNKAKMTNINNTDDVVDLAPPATPPASPCPVPPVKLYECRDKKGKLILQVYATSIISHKCHKDLICKVK